MNCIQEPWCRAKTRKINYKVNVRQKIEPENWIRVEGTHEPIVSKEIFECVQKLMELDTRTSPEEESIYEFSGLLRCGDCGQNLVRRTTTKKERNIFTIIVQPINGKRDAVLIISVI